MNKQAYNIVFLVFLAVAAIVFLSVGDEPNGRAIRGAVLAGVAIACIDKWSIRKEGSLLSKADYRIAELGKEVELERRRVKMRDEALDSLHHKLNIADNPVALFESLTKERVSNAMTVFTYALCDNLCLTITKMLSESLFDPTGYTFCGMCRELARHMRRGQEIIADARLTEEGDILITVNHIVGISGHNPNGLIVQSDWKSVDDYVGQLDSMYACGVDYFKGGAGTLGVIYRRSTASRSSHRLSKKIANKNPRRKQGSLTVWHEGKEPIRAITFKQGDVKAAAVLFDASVVGEKAWHDFLSELKAQLGGA